MADSITSGLIDLACPECHKHYAADRVQTICPDCLSPLLAEYDLLRLARELSPEMVKERPRGIWRWAELLPVRQARFRVSLGEGDTPIVPLPRLGNELGLKHLYLKDDGINPTGSFKARGMAVAISRALELGLTSFVIPSAGNAGGALAAYAGRAGVEAHVYLPADAPVANQLEVKLAGANLHLIDGLIDQAGRLAAADGKTAGWFNLSTLQEPYRLEGKKTMGFELAEAYQWDLPDVIIYPTGGGTGLLGMWKAFSELQVLGWTGSRKPRMVSVQAEGCAPIVKAFQQGASRTERWENAQTRAAGLRVPVVFADRMILRALRESQGTAIAVSETELFEAQKKLATQEGIFPCLEGAATLAALPGLISQGWVSPDERIVLYNTGCGLKYG